VQEANVELAQYNCQVTSVDVPRLRQEPQPTKLIGKPTK